MKQCSPEHLLEVLKREPEQPFSPADLADLAAYSLKDRIGFRLRPDWLNAPDLEGISPLGLVAMQTINLGHWSRLTQARALLVDPIFGIRSDLSIPETGLVWLAAGKSAQARGDQSKLLAKAFMDQGASVDQLWQDAWRVCCALRTQNAVDPNWWGIVGDWAEPPSFPKQPAPSPFVGASLILDMGRSTLVSFQARELESIGALTNGHPLLTLVAQHGEPEEAKGWFLELLKRKRKLFPGLDVALATTLQRGATLTLPKRMGALAPQSFAVARAIKATTNDDMPGRRSRLRARA